MGTQTGTRIGEQEVQATNNQNKTKNKNKDRNKKENRNTNMDKNSRARGRIITRKARTRTGTTGRTGE